MGSLPLSGLPALNAALNATCAVLLVSGYLMIRRRKVLVHKICMGSAFAVAVISWLRISRITIRSAR